MHQYDIHLAAARLSDETRRVFEAQGFTEDFFRDCRNCAPTLYHATFRGPPERVNDALWNICAYTLKSDCSFNGILELESLVQEHIEAREVRSELHLPPSLPIKSCPAHLHKACDVHTGIKLDSPGAKTAEWLEALSIASFQKTRPDGEWRIFTATFDEVVAGEQFYEWVVSNVPRSGEATFKVKFERIERALRLPTVATTLPLTYGSQLYAWLASMGEEDGAAEGIRRVV